MKKSLLIYFVFINAFCFVVTAADLKVPWIDDAAATVGWGDEGSIGIVTQSALGGALGSYGGLLLADRFDGGANEALRRSLLVLVGQNAVGYALVILTVGRRNRRYAGERMSRTEEGPGRTGERPSESEFRSKTWKDVSA
jgi:hypothetical protein